MESFLKVMGREGKTSAEWAVYESWIVSSLLLACFFGAPFAAPLSDTYGRKWCIFIAMFITTVGTTIQAGASNFSTMIGTDLFTHLFPFYFMSSPALLFTANMLKTFLLLVLFTICMYMYLLIFHDSHYQVVEL